MKEFRLLGGKHKFKLISDPHIPTAYLIWIEETWNLDESQRESLNFEIQRRTSQVTSLGRVVREAKNA